MIVDRALVREVLQTSVAVTFVILSIFVVVRSLGFLQQAVLAVFALSFSFVDPRQGRLPSMIMAFMAYFLYTNVLGFAVAMLSRSRIDPAVGLWWVHAIFLFPVPRLSIPRFRSRTA